MRRARLRSRHRDHHGARRPRLAKRLTGEAAMSVLTIQTTVPSRKPRIAARGAGRLLRIELRRNAMLWMLPVAAALFYYHAYRHIMALPAMWNIRAMSLQNDALLDFAAGDRRGRLDGVAGEAPPRHRD